MFSSMPDMSMSGTLNGVELCMLHGSWVLEMVFEEKP